MWSDRAIAKHVGCDNHQVKRWWATFLADGDVQDEHRSGRTPIIPAAALDEAESIVLQSGDNKLFSSARVAEVLKSSCGVTASARTVSRNLRSRGWRYGHGKRVLMLKPLHKQRRLHFAKHHLGKKTSFASYMITDSKLFLLHKTASKPGLQVWYPPGQRPNFPVPANSIAVHTYTGATKFGLTPPIFVTGGGSQKSVHTNPKTGQPYSGVSAIEYQQDVLPKLLQAGNRIFANSGRWASEWKFQQDNARPHAAKSTKAVLNNLMPGRVEQNWPAMSPDLSWIENIWAWADRKLRTDHSNIQSIDELKAALTDIFASVPKSMLRNHVSGMRGRLQKIVERHGGHIA